MSNRYEPILRRILIRDDAPVSAYWINHAGGGTNSLVNRMRTIGDDCNVDVRSLAMPAREDLFDVAFDGDLRELAVMVAHEIVDQRRRENIETPFAMIGHSFGSVLAYRITCELSALGATPIRLIVMSFPAPDHASHHETLHTLSDSELVERVDVLFGGLPEDIKNNVDAQSFFVPGLRFDLELLEGYFHDADSTPLPIPITAVCGIDDRAVGMTQMQRWRMSTSDQFRLMAMPGNHFFPLSRITDILKLATARSSVE